jgi:hypothetical protein
MTRMQYTFQFINVPRVHSNFHYVLPKCWLRQVTVYVGITRHSLQQYYSKRFAAVPPRKRGAYSKHIARIHLVQYFSLHSTAQ